MQPIIILKGCNNNALKDTDDTTVIFQSDGYSNCAKAGSGSLFAKTTHNGQNCGISDLNGNMWRIAIGLTCVSSDKAIEAMSQANPCVITITSHGLTTNNYIQINAITQADWSGCKDKLWQVIVLDPDTFSIAFNASGFGTAYDAGTDSGTVTIGKFYAAKEAISMKDFTSGASSATDHWGSTGVAAMMEEVVIPFKSGVGFSLKWGNGNTQVFSETDNILNYLTLPRSGNSVSSTGTDKFGKDYFYQYILNQLCVSCGGYWNGSTFAGMLYRSLYSCRTYSSRDVGFSSACYL
jgi:hypothetical protein